MAPPDDDAMEAIITTDTSLELERRNDRAAPLVAVDRVSSSLAAAAEAQIKAQVWAARAYPRSLPAVRDRALEQIRRPSIAETATYEVKNRGSGLTIKAANMLRIAMGNMTTSDVVVADTEDERTIQVTAVDLESNTAESRMLVVRKVVERRGERDGGPPRGRIVVGPPRPNSYGDLVYPCRATEDEIPMIAGAATAKARRGCILALVPEDIKQQVFDLSRAIAANAAASNRAATLDKLRAWYAKGGITSADLSAYLGRDLELATTEDLVMLQQLAQAIGDKQTTWKEAVRSREEAVAEEARASAPPAQTADSGRSRKKAADAVDDATRK